jgi:1-acyl-sn-glycerol-3-phosphate acyltransferase
MIVLRSTLFMIALTLFTLPCAIVAMLSFPLPHHMRHASIIPWIKGTSWLIEHLLGIRCEVRGRENIPARPCVVLAKHQSAWETIVLQTVFSRLAFVWKKELKRLPFFGWALATVPSIEIDRAAGKDALRQLEEQGRARLAEGYSVIIFPDGTRVPPGQKKRYKVGGAHLAASAGVAAVPVALNSGECWGRNAFFKRPGRVTVSIGPAIEPAGLSAEDINLRVETWIESEMRRISPHLYRDEAAPAATRAAA